jgi:hypothetical protein
VPVLPAVVALLAFVISILTSVYILIPKKKLIFAEAGSGLYEGLYAIRDDIGEVYRRLAYQLDRFWESNDVIILGVSRAFGVAAFALVVEIISLAAILSGTLF